MKYIAGAIIATIAWAVLLQLLPIPEYRIYDCSISEFHPDYPPKVKEECRKKRIEKHNITV